MAIRNRTRAVAPYAQQLLHDEQVRDAAWRAFEAARYSYQRARGESPSEALADKKLWRRIQEAQAEAAELWAGLTAPPPRRARRHWQTLALVTAGCLAVFVAANPDTREVVLNRVGGGTNTSPAN